MKALFITHEGFGDSIFRSQVIEHCESMKANGFDFDVLTYETFTKSFARSLSNLNAYLKGGTLNVFLKRAANIYMPGSSLINLFILARDIQRNLKSNQYKFIHARADYTAFLCVLLKPFHKGVDMIEAGFAIASPGDFEAVNRIAQDVGQLENGPIVASLARCNKTDIDRAWGAVQAARKPRIHTFLATSDIHLQHKLKMSRNDCLEQVGDFVAYARGLCADVEFSPEDAGRSDPEFLYQVLDVAVAAGATTLNIPDTVGDCAPAEYGALIAGILKNVPSITSKGVIISVHCHDDLGLATRYLTEICPQFTSHGKTSQSRNHRLLDHRTHTLFS